MPRLTTSGATRGIKPTHVSGIGSIAAKPPSFCAAGSISRNR
jgi:hypothetical protein